MQFEPWLLTKLGIFHKGQSFDTQMHMKTNTNLKFSDCDYAKRVMRNLLFAIWQYVVHTSNPSNLLWCSVRTKITHNYSTWFTLPYTKKSQKWRERYLEFIWNFENDKTLWLRLHFYLTVKVAVLFARPDGHFLNYSNIVWPILRFRQQFFLLTSYSPKRVCSNYSR